MFPRLSMLALPLVLSPALAAQAASYTTFGTGCPGSAAGTVLASNNPNTVKLASLAVAGNPTLALIVTPKTSVTVVTGFEIFTKARKKVTVPAYIYLPDKTGKPSATPLATGTLTVGTSVGWYRATFAKPVIVKGQKTFMLSWKWSSIFSKDFEWPQDASKTATKSSMFWAAQQGNKAWQGPSKGEPWAWKVLGPGGTRLVPALGNTGVPKLATSFQLELTKARASSAAILLFGASNTSWGPAKLPLAIGSTGCSLLVSFDLPLVMATDIAGKSQTQLLVPNDKTLVGSPFYNQWIVLDPGANALNLVFSNGGKGLIGN